MSGVVHMCIHCGELLRTDPQIRAHLETIHGMARALLFRPGEEPVEKMVDGFEGIVRALDGATVERVVLISRPDGAFGVQLWCDEDGIGKGLPLNVLIPAENDSNPNNGTPIVGPAVVCGFRRVRVGTEDEDEEERSLTDAEVRAFRLLPRFGKPGRPKP